MRYVCLKSSRFLKIPAWENISVFLKHSIFKPQLTRFSPWQCLKELDVGQILSMKNFCGMSSLYNQITYTGHILKANDILVVKMRKTITRQLKPKPKVWLPNAIEKQNQNSWVSLHCINGRTTKYALKPFLLDALKTRSYKTCLNYSHEISVCCSYWIKW